MFFFYGMLCVWCHVVIFVVYWNLKVNGLIGADLSLGKIWHGFFAKVALKSWTFPVMSKIADTLRFITPAASVVDFVVFTTVYYFCIFGKLLIRLNFFIYKITFIVGKECTVIVGKNCIIGVTFSCFTFCRSS